MATFTPRISLEPYTGNITATGLIIGESFRVASGTRIRDNGDGTFLLQNSGENNFGALKLGGTSSLFPALKRNGTAVEVRLADDSGTGFIIAKLPTSNPGPGIPWNNGGTIELGT